MTLRYLLLIALLLPTTLMAKRNSKNNNVAPVTRVARSLDPCEELALEECKYFRAAGSGTASNESEARSAAMSDARSQLAQMIRVVVDGSSQDYSRNMDGDKKSAQSIGEEVMNQFVFQSLESTKPIMWSKYDLSNGKVQIYVCVEMTKDPEEFSTDLQAQLTIAKRNPAQPATNPTPSTLIESSPEADALCEEGCEDYVRQKYSTAIPKLMKAMELGSIKAHYHVGLLYLYGNNVELDTKRAFKYILIAAKGGNKEAVFQVAELYNSGTGVAKDKTQARYWFEKAKELGDPRADSRLRRL